MLLTTKNNTKTLRGLAAGLTALLVSATSICAQQAPGQSAEMRSLQQEYQSISQQLQQAQQAAMKSPEVKSAIEMAQTILKQKMMDAAPKKAEQIKRFFKLQDQLREEADDLPQAKAEAKIQELRGIQGEIKTAQEQAMQSEAFQDAQKDAQTAMRTAMTEDNPETEKLMRRQREIINKARANQQRQAPVAPAQ